MIKRLLLLCLSLLTLLPCAQSEGNVAPPPPYRLVPVAWLDQDAEYTLISHKTPIIADPLALALFGSESPDIGASADTVQTAIRGETLLEQGFHVLSVSPDAQRTLISDGERLYLLTGNTLRAVALNLSRCDATRRGSMQPSIRYISRKPDQMVGNEGFRWSPDGKHICLLNARLYMRSFQPFPLMLIDTEKGEMFSIRIYEKGMALGSAAAMQGLFSPDSQYLYYTEYRSVSTRLCRYDLTNKTHELLADTHQGMVAYPAMGMNENGDILSTMIDRENVLLTFREGAGGWDFTQKAFSRLNSVVYFAASGQGAMMELILPNSESSAKIQLVRFDGQMWRITASQKNHGIHFLLSSPDEIAAFSDTQKDDAEDAQKLDILHIAMSPNGSRYLVLLETRDENKSLQSVLISARQDGSLIEVVLPEDMESFRPFLQRNHSGDATGITFLTEDLLLMPGEENRTQLYRLVPGNYF